jgi:hypothetical protein
MIRTTITLGPQTRLESEPLAVAHGDERAVGMLFVREDGGGAVVMGVPARLRALAAEAICAAEQAEEMLRVAELLREAGLTEREAA